jgi:glycosyltransferase involved in cell wall biosynthesis
MGLLPKQVYELFKENISRKINRGQKWLDIEIASLKHQKKPMGINFSGFFSSGLGLGESARNFLKAFQSARLEIALNDVYLESRGHAPLCEGLSFSDSNPFFFNVVHMNPDNFGPFTNFVKYRYFEGHYNIGIWYWELANIPIHWIGCYRFFHEIWVMSEFVREAIASHSPIPVVKMPMVISASLEKNRDLRRDVFQIPEDVYTFLFIFDFFSNIERKNPIAVVKAFKDNFKNKRNVLLVLKTINGDKCKSDFHSLEKEIGKCSNVMIIDRSMDRKTIDGLITLSDCYVSLHRSEGLGLGIAEAMFLGKPVITTAYSGNMEFTKEDNCFLVNYKLVELDKDYGLYKRGNVWAEPDISHAGSLMKYVYENRGFAQQIALNGQRYIKKRFNERVAGNAISARLEKILKNIKHL